MASSIVGGNIPTMNTAFNTKYVLSGLYSVQRLKELLCDDTFIQNFQLLFNNPSDFINSIKCYPLYLGSFLTTSSNYIRLGKINTNILANNVYTVRKGVNIANIKITPKYNNFMDYEPYTKVDLYVPYFSFISLPTNEVMNKTINLYLTIDFDTGIGTLYIQVDGRVITTATQKLGIDIPIGSSNYNEIVKDNIANAIKTTAGIVMLAVGGGVGKTAGSILVAKGLSMAVTSGVDAVTGSTVRYTRGSLTGGSDMLSSPTSVYAIITRPNPVPITSDYNHIKGKPLGDIRVLSTLRGFTIIDQIHLQNMPNALDEEMNEIEALMKEGIEL